MAGAQDKRPILFAFLAEDCKTCREIKDAKTGVWPKIKADLDKEGKIRVVELLSKAIPGPYVGAPGFLQSEKYGSWAPRFVLVPADQLTSDKPKVLVFNSEIKKGTFVHKGLLGYEKVGIWANDQLNNGLKDAAYPVDEHAAVFSEQTPAQQRTITLPTFCTGKYVQTT